MVDSVKSMPNYDPQTWFATCDPSKSRLGSGGGTAHLLAEAWKADGCGRSFSEWLKSSRKLVVHGGGQSRRLPAYAATGKLFIPIPALRNSYGNSLRQTLLDIQLPAFENIYSQASAGSKLMITSGDVLLRFGSNLPKLPEADIVALGMRVEPEQAEHFGVFFTGRELNGEINCFFQKPPAARITELARDYGFLVDTGVWLLSERAVMTLMNKCGWDEKTQNFSANVADFYELYARFGLSLGTEPIEPDAEINKLTSAVVALPSPEFYHLGTNRQLIESVTLLQNRGNTSFLMGMRHPDQIIQNSDFVPPADRMINHSLWIENSIIPETWKLDSEHILTGIPDNKWIINLEAGVCLDFAPIGEREFCIRPYGIGDSFSGEVGDKSTLWFGRPVVDWFKARGISFEDAGIKPDTDIQSAGLFPVLGINSVREGFVEWLFSTIPTGSERWIKCWLESIRLSAEQIRSATNIDRLLKSQNERRQMAMLRLYNKQDQSIFHRLDLLDTARIFAGAGVVPYESQNKAIGPVLKAHYCMFHSAVKRELKREDWPADEQKAFTVLREAIITEAGLAKATPECRVLQDQIVWGRSPARLDLAGGWTDAPPYCLEHGGKVVNLAVNLNGQPPIQVFAKLCERPEYVIRSIDLGVEQRITTYEELATYSVPKSGFALAKAALAMAGFLPEFHGSTKFSSLKEQFKAFGGGIEISLVAAIPQGSGLGTSSILAATLLGTLSELCGLGWDKHELVGRTLAVEQMLTTGGGWQDQAGALFSGLKLIETDAGLPQRITVRWLPDQLFGQEYANELVLLYYSGITRLAKNILEEIVRGMFLNSVERIRILDRMREHAMNTMSAIQLNDWSGLCEAVKLSWELNQSLDSGTNPPPVQELMSNIEDYIASAKLLGAGGGGYLLIFAKDIEAAARIRHTLTQNPLNSRARFVDMSLSRTGLEITRS